MSLLSGSYQEDHADGRGGREGRPGGTNHNLYPFSTSLVFFLSFISATLIFDSHVLLKVHCKIRVRNRIKKDSYGLVVKWLPKKEKNLSLSPGRVSWSALIFFLCCIIFIRINLFSSTVLNCNL